MHCPSGLIPGRRCGIWASAQKSRTARRGLCCGVQRGRCAQQPGRAQWRCAQRGMIFLLICRETISCGIWKGAGAVCSLACTLGAGVDAALRAAGASDMAYAVVLDALASVAVEQTADAAEQTLRNEEREEGQFLTGRFSPGYGDYPIAVQNDLLRLLDAPRKIGLCATPTHLLTPRKSVTAVLGVAGHPVTGRRAGCANCALRERCAYRKEGKTCE